MKRLDRMTILVLLALRLAASKTAVSAAQIHKAFLPLVATTPLGVEIVFTSTEGIREICVINSDGSGFYRFTYTPPGAESVSPTWSPDRQQIAFVSNLEGQYDLYVMNRNGSNLEKIQLPISVHEPDWSPDGKQIAFTAPDGIYSVHLDSNQLTRLTDASEDAFNPAWSPDGKHLAYTVWIGGYRVIRLRDLVESTYTDFRDAPGSAFTPAWSPDGTRIAFASSIGDKVDIYSLNLDGSGLIQLTDSPAFEYAPAWSPDGTRLVFTRFEEVTRQNDLYLVNADGSGYTYLTSFGDEPAWAP